MASSPTGETLDVVVVGAGPGGRALAHRCATAGLSVALVDPRPDKPWSQTFGAFVDDLPVWLSSSAIASRSEAVSVYTPRRRVLARPYCVLDNSALQNALHLDGVRIITGTAAALLPRRVSVRTTGALNHLDARLVVDATGRNTGADVASAPRQRAFGVIGTAPDATETVLMDWRPPATEPSSTPTFSYRVPLGGGRFLVEETFLAGTPPPVDDLARRWAQRPTPQGWIGDPSTSPIEVVDFPLTASAPAPWNDDGRALRYGAAGGLMHQATGYSVAASLRCADTVANAVVRGHDPRAALWPWRARAVYRLRERGLRVLTALGPDDTARFFDAFFSVDPGAQRAYLSSRDDLGGVLRAMRGTFAATDWSGRRRILARAVPTGMEQIRTGSR